jgi:hypothetical protein
MNETQSSNEMKYRRRVMCFLWCGIVAAFGSLFAFIAGAGITAYVLSGALLGAGGR